MPEMSKTHTARKGCGVRPLGCGGVEVAVPGVAQPATKDDEGPCPKSLTT